MFLSEYADVEDMYCCQRCGSWCYLGEAEDCEDCACEGCGYHPCQCEAMPESVAADLIDNDIMTYGQFWFSMWIWIPGLLNDDLALTEWAGNVGYSPVTT